MVHNNVWQCLTRSFKNSKTFDCGNKADAVSATRIRSSIATDIASTGEENLETLAICFMKHRPETCKKFYIRHFCQRQSVRISMGCAKNFGVGERMMEDVRKEVQVLEESMEGVPVASVVQIKDYAKKNFEMSEQESKKMDKWIHDVDIPTVHAPRTEGKAAPSRKSASNVCYAEDAAEEPLSTPSTPHSLERVVFLKEDWMKSQKHARELFLAVLHIIGKEISNRDKDNFITSKEWFKALEIKTASEYGCPLDQVLGGMGWTTAIKSIIKAMQRKHWINPNSAAFKNMMGDAQQLYKEHCKEQ